jgi:hypothetical protein
VRDAWSRRSSRRLQLEQGEFDLTVDAYEHRPGELGISVRGYESRIVGWKEANDRLLPVMDMERPTRDRLLHFLDSPGRALLLEAAIPLPLKEDREALFRDQRPGPAQGERRRGLRFARQTETQFERFALFVGPETDEKVVQTAASHEVFMSGWRRVGFLLDGMDAGHLPQDGDIVPDPEILRLAEHAVGFMIGLPDNAYLFWWAPGWERFAHVDDSKTTVH